MEALKWQKREPKRKRQLRRNQQRRKNKPLMISNHYKATIAYALVALFFIPSKINGEWTSYPLQPVTSRYLIYRMAQDRINICIDLICQIW